MTTQYIKKERAHVLIFTISNYTVLLLKTMCDYSRNSVCNNLISVGDSIICGIFLNIVKASNVPPYRIQVSTDKGISPMTITKNFIMKLLILTWVITMHMVMRYSFNNDASICLIILFNVFRWKIIKEIVCCFNQSILLCSCLNIDNCFMISHCFTLKRNSIRLHKIISKLHVCCTVKKLLQVSCTIRCTEKKVFLM